MNEDWQSSLSAQQLGKHIDKPEGNWFSKTFSDPKYMENGGGFTKVYRGLITEPIDAGKDWRTPSSQEITANVGQHWSTNPVVAGNYAKKSADMRTAAKHGEMYEALAHNKDIWSYDEPGALEHFDAHEIYHPDSEQFGSDFNESEVTIKQGSPVLVKKRTDFKDENGDGYMYRESTKEFNRPKVFRV